MTIQAQAFDAKPSNDFAKPFYWDFVYCKGFSWKDRELARSETNKIDNKFAIFDDN